MPSLPVLVWLYLPGFLIGYFLFFWGGRKGNRIWPSRVVNRSVSPVRSISPTLSYLKTKRTRHTLIEGGFGRSLSDRRAVISTWVDLDWTRNGSPHGKKTRFDPEPNPLLGLVVPYLLKDMRSNGLTGSNYGATSCTTKGLLQDYLGTGGVE